MPSRRALLAAAGTTLAAGLAGCSGSGSGDSATRDCQSSALDHGDGDLLDGGVWADTEDDQVRLVVPLSVDDVESSGVARLRVFDADGSLQHVIPVSSDDADVMANKDEVNEGQLLYEQVLGERPQHGQLEVVAVDDAGERVDSIAMEFSCFADVQG